MRTTHVSGETVTGLRADLRIMHKWSGLSPNVKALQLCSCVKMSGQVFRFCHKSCLRGLSLHLRRNRTPVLRDGRRAVWSYRWRKPDLFSHQLWWVTNLHLLALSVTVDKTDEDWEAWRLGHYRSWMCNTCLHLGWKEENMTNPSEVYTHLRLSTSEQSAVCFEVLVFSVY